MTCLPDVHVWIALTIAEHIHHRAARAWYEQNPYDAIAWARITQMGFLRLLTNPKVMGRDALTSAGAWAIWDDWSRDPHVISVAEPYGMEDAWRGLTSSSRTGPNYWTDAYLAAFSLAAGFTLVTFDRSLARTKDVSVEFLKPS